MFYLVDSGFFVDLFGHLITLLDYLGVGVCGLGCLFCCFCVFGYWWFDVDCGLILFVGF